MENKINIAELLKDCPKGMELYSPIFGEVYLDKIRPHLAIVVTIGKEQSDSREEFLYDGRYGMNGECMLFPSKNKTWERFVPPIKFKDGDVVISTSNNIHLISCRDKNNGWESCCCIIYGKFNSTKTAHVIPTRLATEEEKQELFKAINDNGYRWDDETKTLKKLSKFKVGDRVKHISAYTTGIVVKVDDKGYYIDCPKNGGVRYISFSLEKDYELVPNKFDITTLKPFDKVLVRHNDDNKWCGSFFSHRDKDLHSHCFKFVTTAGKSYPKMIPYEGNEHLLGTTNDCDDFYKTWEK